MRDIEIKNVSKFKIINLNKMLSFLKELITTNPFVEDIDLENKGITSLDPHSVDLLGRFSELKKINLADNHIRKLPNDLSAM